MPFKYINGKIVEVEHKTVYGRLVYDIGGLSKWPRIAEDWNEYCQVIENCTTPVGRSPRNRPIYDSGVSILFCYPPFEKKLHK